MSNEIQILDELRAILVDPNLGDKAARLTALLRLSVDKDTRRLEGVDLERIAESLNVNHRQRITAALKEAVDAGHLQIKRIPNRPASYRMPMTAERMERITAELLPLANLKRSVAPKTELVELNSGRPEKRTTGKADDRESGPRRNAFQDHGGPQKRSSSYMQDSIQDSSQGVGQNLPYAQTTTPLKEPPPYPLQSIPGSSVQRQIQYVPQPFNYAQPLPPSRRLIRGLGSLTDHWVARLERLKGGLGTFERETDCLEALEGVARKFEPHIAIHAICELEADRIRGRKGGDPLKAIWIVAEQCKAKIARDPNLLHPDAQHTRRAFQRANLGL